MSAATPMTPAIPASSPAPGAWAEIPGCPGYEIQCGTAAIRSWRPGGAPVPGGRRTEPRRIAVRSPRGNGCYAALRDADGRPAYGAVAQFYRRTFPGQPVPEIAPCGGDGRDGAILPDNRLAKRLRAATRWKGLMGRRRPGAPRLDRLDPAAACRLMIEEAYRRGWIPGGDA